MAEPARCLGCGGTHFAGERVCPRTKRPVEEGAFGSLVGPYRVGKLLGAGGFGSVHFAEDTRDGTSVALKLLHPELVAEPAMLDRFTREAEVTIRAGNPHIVRVLGASFSGRSVYVALELLSGDTLANALRGGPLEAERAVDIAIQMLDGLAVAHAAGVIHRDIKPANVFLADEPGAPRSLVKLLDFGIGRMLASDQNQRLTRTGTQLGTPHFMAPEQVADAKRADARADLYAVGVTLFAMLSGERPYGRASVGQWIALVTARTPPPRVTSSLGPLPPALVDALAVALSVEPAQRFQDAGAFARALLDSLPSSPAQTRELPALARTPTFHAPPVWPAPSSDALPATGRPSADVAAQAARVSAAPQQGRLSAASPGHTGSPRALTFALLGAVVVIAFLVGAGVATAAGLVVYSQYNAQQASLAASTPAASAPAGAARVPIVTPAGSGVHLYEAQPWSGSVIALGPAHAVLVGTRGRFESCRVVGRGTHASVLISVVPRTGEAVSWMPDPYSANDEAASRCLGERYKEASSSVRYGTTLGGAFLLEADFDAI